MKKNFAVVMTYLVVHMSLLTKVILNSQTGLQKRKKFLRMKIQIFQITWIFDLRIVKKAL